MVHISRIVMIGWGVRWIQPFPELYCGKNIRPKALPIFWEVENIPTSSCVVTRGMILSSQIYGTDRYILYTLFWFCANELIFNGIWCRRRLKHYNSFLQCQSMYYCLYWHSFGRLEWWWWLKIKMEWWGVTVTGHTLPIFFRDLLLPSIYRSLSD